MHFSSSPIWWLYTTHITNSPDNPVDILATATLDMTEECSAVGKNKR